MTIGKLKKISDNIPIQMLKGDRGESGKDGKDGKDGRDGIDGRDGKDGESAVGIRGERGYDGKDGEQGLPPAHQISNGEIRFQNPDGTWGKWLNIGGQARSSGGGGGGVFGKEEPEDLLRNPEFSYDSEGKLEKITYDNGATKDFSYNSDGLLEFEVKTVKGVVTTKQFTYNTDKQLINITQI